MARVAAEVANVFSLARKGDLCVNWVDEIVKRDRQQWLEW